MTAFRVLCGWAGQTRSADFGGYDELRCQLVVEVVNLWWPTARVVVAGNEG